MDARREGQGIEFVKRHYLEPDPIGRKAFELLPRSWPTKANANLQDRAQGREQLAALNPFTKTMLLTTLHCPTVRSLASSTSG